MKNDFNKVIELYTNGYSTDEIVSETGISRATAYRWIKQHNASLSLSANDEEDDDPDDFPEDGEDPETSQLNGLELKQKELELKEREIAAREQQEFIAGEKLKHQTLKDFRSLLQGIQEHCTGSVWKADELRKVSLEIDVLTDKIHEIFYFSEDALEDNSILAILNVLKEIFKDYENFAQVTMDFSDENIRMIEYGTDIGELEDVDFDKDDYDRNIALESFTDLVDEIMEGQGTKLSGDECDQVLVAIRQVRENLTQELPGVSGEFDDELHLLDEIETHVKELHIRCEESFWGVKPIMLTTEIIEQYQELVSEYEEAAVAV